MSLARYPDVGEWLRISVIPEGGGELIETERDSHYGRFAYDDARPSSWEDLSDLWVHGYWVHDWSDQYHRVERLDLDKQKIHPEKPYHGYGYKRGSTSTSSTCSKSVIHLVSGFSTDREGSSTSGRPETTTGRTSSSRNCGRADD